MDNPTGHYHLEGIRCPACSGPYNLVRILGRQGRSYKLLVRCPVCNIYGIGTAQVRGAEPASSDPPLSIVAKYSPRPTTPPPTQPVSEQDVVAMREFLRTFDGDFRSLWATGS